MREFSNDSRFSVRSLPEIVELVSTLTIRLKARGFGLDGKLSREILVNSIFLGLDSLPADQQRSILDAGLGRLQSLLAMEEGAGSSPAPSGYESVDVVVKQAEPPADPSARRKRLSNGQ